MSASHFLQVPEFVVHSEYAQQYILYTISQHLHSLYSQQLCVVSPTYVEVESLYISVHNSGIVGVSYNVKFGRGYRLPRINYM